MKKRLMMIGMVMMLVFGEDRTGGFPHSEL